MVPPFCTASSMIQTLVQETLIQESGRREERERARARVAKHAPQTRLHCTFYYGLHTAAEPRATEAAHLNVKTEDGRNGELSTVYTVSTVYTKVNYVLDLNVKMFIFQRGVFAALKRSQECSWKCR